MFLAEVSQPGFVDTLTPFADPALKLLGAAVATVFGWGVSHYVKNERLRRGFAALEKIAEIGVKSAWGTYTDEKKKAAPDGKLTPEQVIEARSRALAAARAAMGGAAKELLSRVFSDGLDTALQHAIEAKYSELKPALAA